MAPSGRAGMMPKEALHDLQKRRGLPCLSLPHPIVGPAHFWHGTGAVVVGKEECMVVFSDLELV